MINQTGIDIGRFLSILGPDPLVSLMYNQLLADRFHACTTSTQYCR